MFFLVGGGAGVFFQQLKPDFFKQSESILFFVTIKSLFTIAISPLCVFNFSFIKYICDQHSSKFFL